MFNIKSVSLILFLFCILTSVEIQAGNFFSSKSKENKENEKLSRGSQIVQPRAISGGEVVRHGSSLVSKKPKRQVIVSECGWFIHFLQNGDSPVSSEHYILPSEYIFNIHNTNLQGSTISEVDNNWPNDLANASLFPYLIEGSDVSDIYLEFCAFVQKYYKSSCAIVYYPENGYPKIIGSGSLIKESRVATARHVFEGVDLSRLYARFFDYAVTNTTRSDCLRVIENYIDIPVVSPIRAASGLDAGYLDLVNIPRELVSRFMRILPTTSGQYTDGFTTLPPGYYAMFHFAGGKHLLSTGHVKSLSFGSFLHNNINIDAGTGASGAAIIQKNFERIASHGISIYRNILNDMGERRVERRIIPFERFSNAGAINDYISAPYVDPSFCIVPPTSLEESGYEFLKWHWSFSSEGGANRPNSVIYDLSPQYPDQHSNHHIIPRGDLWFLWEYFATSARKQVEETVKSEVLEAKRKGKSIKFDKTARINELLAQEERRYASIRHTLNQLSPEWPTPRDHQARRFAWSYWNLFKGWKGEFRLDDPVRDGFDRSEKRKPKNFNKRLWESLKSQNVGLYDCIQALRAASKRGLTSPYILENLENALNNIYSAWASFQKSNRTIYIFDEDEWEEVGYLAHPTDHTLYKLK